MTGAAPDALPLAVCLIGPTASGKSGLALALAQALPLEIVSVDSAQVFRGMDIGTAKPSAAERAQVPHHLIDLVRPDERYSAARFRADALAAMSAIVTRGRLPLLVGGSMLYFRALEYCLSDLPEADPALRLEIERAAAERGWPALHAELARRDPESAARLRPSDAQRIARALEIVRLTGGPLAHAYARRRHAPLPLRLLKIGLAPSLRSALHARIAQRFEAMLAAGLVEELRSLRARYPLQASLPSMRCVGYRQAWQHLESEFGAAELHDRGIYATRQLAKRQLTWLNNSMPGIQVLDCLRGDLAPAARALIEAQVEG